MMIWNNAKTASGGGISVTAAEQGVLLDDIAECFENQTGFSIATLNLDHVVNLSRDPDFLQAYRAHTHVTADGNPIVWLSRLAGQGAVQLIPGSELIAPVAALAEKKRVPVAFLGSTEASLSAAADALREQYPQLEVALKLAPPMGFDPEGPRADEAIEAIARSEARLVFLAMGAPKQEKFAARAQERLKQVGFLSIGAGLDFISGHQTRAPAWVRAIAAEWLWRLLSDPRRLGRRYLDCILVLPGLTLRAFGTRLRGSTP